jgi:hypothetical protein
MLSTPRALISSAFSTKPGRCFAEQVGVNAPGSANNTTRLPPKRSPVATSFVPSLVTALSFTSGSFSPTWIAMALLRCSGVTALRRRADPRVRGLRVA